MSLGKTQAATKIGAALCGSNWRRGAARFHHAVDSAIVLSNDGVIRWLGDPVARLCLGPSVLTPGAVILADEALPVAAQDIVKARIDLWLAAMMRRILGPLFALDALQEGSEVVRDLAARLARSLGILEREPIRGKSRRSTKPSERSSESTAYVSAPITFFCRR